MANALKELIVNRVVVQGMKINFIWYKNCEEVVMSKRLVLLATVVFASFSGLVSAAGHLMVDNAWVREAPPGAMALAGYMTLHNSSDKPRLLVSAESESFEKVMLHRTVMEGTISKMVHQHMITIPANGMVSFEPNSYHLMMMKPKQPLKAGDKVSVTLHFKSGDTQDVSHVVRTGMAGMGGMNHGEKSHGH